MNLFFADLHGHSVVSDGHYVRGGLKDQFDREHNTPAAYFEYARDVAGLHVVALTDHVPVLDEASLQAILDEAERWNEPGRFVALGGYEWERIGAQAAGERIGDHTPVYFPSSRGRVIPRGAGQGGVDSLCRELKPLGALAHAGHPCYWGLTDWRMDYGEIRPNAAMLFTELDLVDERYVSRTYCTEYAGCEAWHPEAAADRSVQAGLAAGVRIGFVGESDSHDGRPGSGPLTGLWAERLDRESVFDALRRRRVYATTGARLRLETFSLAGCPMGSATTVAGPAVDLHARIVGTEPIARVELVAATRGADTPFPTLQEWTPGTREIDLHEEVSFPGRDGFGYLRILQEDGHRAWSSPVWLGE